MYSKDFDRSLCSESDILRSPVGFMDPDRAVLHEVCWRPEGEYIDPEFVGGEVQSKNEKECKDKVRLQLKTVDRRAYRYQIIRKAGEESRLLKCSILL